MKVALCLSGQYRTFDSPVVQKTLHDRILNKYDCDIYVSLWNNRGISLFHGNPIFYKDMNEEITDKHITDFINPKKLQILNYDNWYNNVGDNIRSLMIRGDICKHTPPQLFQKLQVINLIDNKNYDIVIITRPDMFYVNDIELEKYTDKNTVWNINPEGWSYYSNRIYDIFYMGSLDTIRIMGDCYHKFENMIDDPYNSNLRMLDCCKILYIHAMKNNIKVDTTRLVIGDIYRNDESVSYVCKMCNIDRKTIGI